ncbi:MAG: endolytic transglycosylase MltG [Candidatus Gracilibacteria bacterium]|nr:endolytic transglycosylase MltG [Candidatus Gracilibacteria bacterium]
MRYLSLIIVSFIVIVGIFTYRIPSTMVMKQDFIISQGDKIANLPQKLGISIGSFPYKLYTRFKQKDFVLQAGTYHMDSEQTLDELFNQTLTHPISKDITLTVLPGWNIFDIDAYLTKEGITKAGDFTIASENISDDLRNTFSFIGDAKTLEGMLLPDTYRIKPDATVDDIIRTFLREFDKKIYTPYSFSSQKEFYETLIFASIVEKEEKSSTNKPIVAGVLKKRYREKIAIGADATVCYEYRLTMTDCTPTFIGNHIYEKSAYNTRDSLSLPPTPIANPSAETFLATLNSEPSSYYYYLHDDQGQIHYGRSLEEHNLNRVQYLGK